MADAASRTDSLSAGVRLNSATAELARVAASLFQSTLPVDRDRLAHQVMLLLILCAGGVARFWGLGSVGLHGDEETMAMAVLHIVKDGMPLLPSGMFYPRGLTQLYLMAGSIQLFGESEWALRLPSALCGIALIGLAYLAGRRFLTPRWNLAFTATVAFLPEIIVYSQTARMYIFMLAAIAVFLVCLFAWERSGRSGWLIGAVAALTIGVELHALAITCAGLLVFPGLLQGDRRKLLHGVAAAVIATILFLAIDAWVNAQYPVPPPEFAADLGPPPWERARAPLVHATYFQLALNLAGLVAAFCAIQVGRVVPKRPASIGVTALLLATLVSQLMLFYHLAVLLFVAALVLAYRYGATNVMWRLMYFVLTSALLALIHVTTLAARPGSVIQLAGSMVGEPSVWPYVRIAEFSLVAAVLVAVLIVWGLCRLAVWRQVPDYWLFAMLGVWVPLFAIGLFTWNVPSRYTAASLLPMLIAAFAFAQEGGNWLQRRFAATSVLQRGQLAGRLSSSGVQVAAAVLASVLVIDPAAAARAIDGGYALYPDHKGAAQFMSSQHVVDEDVILAEDVLQQTYYLGAVDYWLISRKYARRFVERRANGSIRDFYTGTGVISSGSELDELLRSAGTRRVFVIGSGENQGDGRLSMRGPQIDAALHSDRFVEVYRGRDGLTRVWRAVSSPGPSGSSAPATVPRAAQPEAPAAAPPGGE